MNTCATCKHWTRHERKEPTTAYLGEALYGDRFPIHLPAFRETWGECAAITRSSESRAWIESEDENSELLTQEHFGCVLWGAA